MNPILEAIATRAASSKETVQTSYDLARLAIQNSVPGHFVECGVYHGAQSAAMARALMDAGITDRHVHMFDTFSGVPAPGPHDKQWIEAGHPVGTACATMDEVRRNMAFWRIDPSLPIYREGPFDKTIPLAIAAFNALPRDGIAILRIDCDLYESTRLCLEYLYPLVSPGGWIICDDFGLDGSRKAVDEFMKGAYPPVMWQKV